MKYFLKCLYNSANAKGRARRKEFWYFVLYSSIVIVLWHLMLMCVFTYFGTYTKEEYSNHLFIFTALGDALMISSLSLPFFTVIARRFHDTGESGEKLVYKLIYICGFISIISGFLFGLIALLLNNDRIFEPDFTCIYFTVLNVLFSFLYFFYYLIKKGTEGDNQYGPDPRIDDPIDAKRNPEEKEGLQ